MSTTKKIQTLLSPDLLNDNQQLCISRLFEHDETLVVASMGFGKTVCTLTAADELLTTGVLRRVLVVAPLKVAKTVWQQEAAKWSHLSSRVAVAGGNPKKRRAAFDSGCPIVVINYECIDWAQREGLLDDFDGVVYDELSKLKKSGGRAFKALRKCTHFKWRVGLTGTPVSEDFLGLYGMVLMLDGGKRLGTRYDRFQAEYFMSFDPDHRIWEIVDPTGGRLLSKIADLIFLADNAAYKAKLPPITRTTVPYVLPPDAMDVYKTMKRDAVVEFEHQVITGANMAVVGGKLQQIASGWLYDEDYIVDLHTAKIDALVDLLHSLDARVMVAYWYQEDLAALKQKFPHAVQLDGKDDQETIDAWNAGKIDMLLVQPRSAGHGIELQGGGSTLVWYGPVWSRDLTEQTEARVWRQGQTEQVDVYTLVGEDTIEELIVQRVEDKGEFQRLLVAHVEGVGFS